MRTAAIATQEINTHARLFQTSRLQAHGLRLDPYPAPHTAMACTDAYGGGTGPRRAAVFAKKLWPDPTDRRTLRAAALPPAQRQHGPPTPANPHYSAKPRTNTERKHDRQGNTMWTR